MVFLIYDEAFLFSVDLAMHRTVRLKHCMGSLHPSFTNGEINTSFRKLQFHFQFPTICVEIKYVQIKNLF